MLVKPLCEVVLWTLAAPRLLFPIDFNAPRAYPLNSLSSNSLVVGDFNGDHIPDLAVTAYDIIGLNQGSGVEIFLGGANGLFHAGGIYQLPSFPGISSSSIVAGDFNHDGNLDLATVTQVGVSILFGNGDGTFQPSVNYSAGTFPTAVAMSDFNGDGNLDLAISNQNSNNVSILLGQADGTSAGGELRRRGPARLCGGGGVQPRRDARPGCRQLRQKRLRHGVYSFRCGGRDFSRCRQP
jgi:FG-GAP-like repeat/FG-GAP repeat